ncbi:hypothetical protein ACHAQA_007490 [Verticillium albo-atrum]
MEVVGLAVGVVGLGLDLSTRLQTYIEGVKDAGDRLSELASDVSATASTVQQLASLLEDDRTAVVAGKQPQAAVGVQDSHNQPSGEPDEESIESRLPLPNLQLLFTDEGRWATEAALRRCKKTYDAIVTILVSATADSAGRTQALLSNVGLSDLTAAKLARLKTKAKWPWLEPRVKACLKQLKAVKLDLLLNLHIANLAKHKLSHQSQPRISSAAQKN